MTEKLILMWNCPDCVKVKAGLDSNLFFREEPGSHGHTLTTLYTFSNSGTRDLLSTLGMSAVKAPALVTDTGAVLDPDEIIAYLKKFY
jgi:hypothetical protein